MTDYILLDADGRVIGVMVGASREPHTAEGTESYEAVDVEAVQALPPDARKAPYSALPKKIYARAVHAECHSFVVRSAGGPDAVIGQPYPTV